MRRIGDGTDLRPEGALFFEAFVRGERRPCVAVRGGAGLRAFLNVCAHRNQPVVVDARPFDADGAIECRAHGARYEPDGGLCVQGPCEGARLVSVPIQEREGGLWVADDDAVDDSAYADEG